MIVYFNGKFIQKSQVFISPDDRGFLFADGLYEVIRSYGGKLFKALEHIDRLNRGACHLKFTNQDYSHLLPIARNLLEKNSLAGEEATIYIQVTRGAAARNHAFPDPAPSPTIYMAANAFDPEKTRQGQEKGIGVITLPDIRWTRCDLKTVGLTANVLASQEAAEAGAKEAIFVRNDMLMEGSHSNFMAVFDGEVATAPADNHILHGITRKTVIQLCEKEGINIGETQIPTSKIPEASEMFITGTTTQITPVVKMNGKPVGTGRPGPVTRALQTAFERLIQTPDRKYPPG